MQDVDYKWEWIDENFERRPLMQHVAEIATRNDHGIRVTKKCH